VFAQAVPSALTFNCVYSMGRHVSLICSRSAAVLPLYVAICSTLSQAIDMCMSILWSVYILPAHLPPPSLMHLSVRLTYMSFLNSSRKEATCFLYVWGRDSMSVWYIMLLNVRLMLPFSGSIALHAKVIISLKYVLYLLSYHIIYSYLYLGPPPAYCLLHYLIMTVFWLSTRSYLALRS